jgi:hypothetical protein
MSPRHGQCEDLHAILTAHLMVVPVRQDSARQAGSGAPTAADRPPAQLTEG